MLHIITKKDPVRWNTLVKSFSNWDVYYLYEYAESFHLHGDGNPLLVYYEDEESRFLYTVMQSDVADSMAIIKAKKDEILTDDDIKRGMYFDWETPYGYGGPLSDGAVSQSSQRKFLAALKKYCNENHIVSQFVRFHPLLKNHNVLADVIETRYLRDTIYMDTTNPEIIINNMDSKNRNMVRKAKKNGAVIERRPISEYQDFLPLYNITMQRNNADEYYTFHDEYFEYLNKMEENACIFYVLIDGIPVSASIMLYSNGKMHYHLSGTNPEYRNFAVGNYLLYEAAMWACEEGMTVFHLGGGMEPNDRLYGFKKQFNKFGRIPFYVGRTIFSDKDYNHLLDIRSKADPNFDRDNGFLIQYRR